MQRFGTELLYSVAMVFLAAVVLREISLLTADSLPSVSRAIEFGIGTGGAGAGTAV